MKAAGRDSALFEKPVAGSDDHLVLALARPPQFDAPVALIILGVEPVTLGLAISVEVSLAGGAQTDPPAPIRIGWVTVASQFHKEGAVEHWRVVEERISHVQKFCHSAAPCAIAGMPFAAPGRQNDGL
jgi:hypothetical protein